MMYKKPLGVALVVSLVSALAMAQAPKTKTKNADSAKSSSKKDAETKKADSPFDDPLMKMQRLRMMVGAGGGGRGGRGGGPGGGGGGGGGFGGGASPANFVLMSKGLQQELKLSAKQKTQLEAVSKHLEQVRGEMFQGMRGNANGGDNGGGNGNGAGGGGGRGGRGNNGGDPEARKAAFAAMREKMDELQEYTEGSVAKVLSAAQQKRVLQIMLQIEGPLAVAKPEVAEEIGLTEEQVAMIEEVMTSMREAERAQWQQRFQGQGGPGGPGGRRQGGQNQDGNGAPQEKAKAADGDAQANGGPGGPRQKGAGRTPPTPEQMKAFADNMKTAALQQEKIRKEAIVAVSKILNKPQRDAFNKLLGKRMEDLTILLPEGGPMGRMPGMPGGRGGPQQNGPNGGGNGAPKGAPPTTKTAQR